MTQTPGYNQNPYGSPYGAPQTPPPDYGNPQYGPTPDQAYGNPQYGSAPEPANGNPQYGGGYAPVGMSPTPVKTAKSPVLGIIGTVSAVLCAVIGGVLFYQLAAVMYNTYGPSIFSGGSVILDPYSLPADAMATLTGSMIGLIILSVIGIVGWILSIVATVTNRGRVFGAIGLIAGIILPIVSIFVATSMFMSRHGLI